MRCVIEMLEVEHGAEREHDKESWQRHRPQRSNRFRAIRCREEQQTGREEQREAQLKNVSGRPFITLWRRDVAREHPVPQWKDLRVLLRTG